MMKDITNGYYVILSVLLMMCVVACNNASNVDNKQNLPESSKTVQVQLIDSLGTVTFSIPLRYDTSISWIHYSDCGKPCNEQKYRLQPKELPITKETGWLWMGEPKDSIERFTISHTGYFPFHDGDTAKNTVSHNHLKEQLKSNPTNPPIVFDTIQKINDRYYSIIVMEKSDSLYSKKALAATTIKSNLLKFQYELLTRKNDSITNNFIQNSIELIKTIRISKGM